MKCARHAIHMCSPDARDHDVPERVERSWPRRVLANAVLACLFGACASGQGGISSTTTSRLASAAARDAEAVFIVTSHYPGPVSLYATHGGSRARLGTLAAWSTIHFEVPPVMVGRGRVIRLVARPIGERRDVTTEAFAVERGDRVFWTLTRPIEGSPATLHVELTSSR